jgi:hypothetical protein
MALHLIRTGKIPGWWRMKQLVAPYKLRAIDNIEA